MNVTTRLRYYEIPQKYPRGEVYSSSVQTYQLSVWSASPQLRPATFQPSQLPQNPSLGTPLAFSSALRSLFTSAHQRCVSSVPDQFPSASTSSHGLGVRM
jgi:hypothetical protein